MRFEKVGLGLARSPSGVRVAVTGRFEMRIFTPDREEYTIGLDSDETTRTLLSGEVKCVTNPEHPVAVSQETKNWVLECARDGLSVLTEKTIVIE